jgi:hypothetical protein
MMVGSPYWSPSLLSLQPPVVGQTAKKPVANSAPGILKPGKRLEVLATCSTQVSAR